MAEILGYNGWRPNRDHDAPNHDKPRVQIPATKFFDNVSFIGNNGVCCFLINTSDGLVLIDCMNPGDELYIEQGIKDLGYDPADLKAVLVTHGHGDHYGNADYFRQKYGTKIYMSAVDEEMALNDTKGPMGAMKWRVDGHIEGGGTFTLGDETIEFYSTPGHTPGCLSFIIPVTDEGRPHKLMLWGGTGVPRDPELQAKYRQSVLDFTAICAREGVDCEVSNHPFVDQLCERLDVVRVITNGTPNPMVATPDAIARTLNMFKDLVDHRIALGVLQ